MSLQRSPKHSPFLRPSPSATTYIASSRSPLIAARNCRASSGERGLISCFGTRGGVANLQTFRGTRSHLTATFRARDNTECWYSTERAERRRSPLPLQYGHGVGSFRFRR